MAEQAKFKPWRLIKMGLGSLLILAVTYVLCRSALKRLDLETTLRDINRIRVRTGGMCHQQPREETLYESTDAGEIEEFISSVELKWHWLAMACNRCGRPTVEFFRGDLLVMSMSFHHGEDIRVDGTWWADSPVSRKSGQIITKWFEKRGITEELLTRKARERAEADSRK